MTANELEVLQLRKVIEKVRQRLIGMTDQKMVAILNRTQKSNITKLNKLL